MAHLAARHRQGVVSARFLAVLVGKLNIYLTHRTQISSKNPKGPPVNVVCLFCLAKPQWLRLHNGG